MDYPKLIVSNQKEESVRIQRVNLPDAVKYIYLMPTGVENIKISPRPIFN